jgi:ABC-type dipeptide/oligopeptide/nickel transport system ATPase component
VDFEPLRLTMIQKGNEIIAAVCGPSKCGKTTTTKAIVAWLWRRHRLRSIIFDPFKDRNDWGPSAWVSSDMEEFRRAAWGTSACAVIWDESSDSLDRNAKEDKRFFTRIRHEHRAFFVMIHDFATLSPLMRGNLSDAIVFRQMEDRARDWASLFCDRDLLQTADLDQYEFVIKSAFRPVRRMRPSPSELYGVDFVP